MLSQNCTFLENILSLTLSVLLGSFENGTIQTFIIMIIIIIMIMIVIIIIMYYQSAASICISMSNEAQVVCTTPLAQPAITFVFFLI